MTDGIGRIFGNSSYGVGGFVPQRNEEKEENVKQPAVQPEAVDIDPSKVMEFLNANNIFVAPKATTAPAELDQETQDRVVNYMARFEEIYSVIEKEFGAALSPAVMDLVMDKLMGLV